MSLISKIAKNKTIQEHVATEDTSAVTDFISTGCLPLNVLFSGRLDGGIPMKKISTISAISAGGKSTLSMKIALNAQRKGLEVIYLDTEYAFDFKLAENLGMDMDKLLVIQNNSVEDTQQIVLQAVDALTKEERAKLLIIVDSFAGLVTSKTMDDALNGKDVSDMTISKKRNSFAKILTGLGCTVFVSTQTYDTMSMYDPLAVSGGKGIFYASSSIVMGTSKAKDKDSSGEITGSIVSATIKKSRLAKENSKLKYLIEYNGGISPFYGMLEDALEGGYVEKPSVGWYTRPCVADDKKWREKDIYTKEFWGPVIKDTDFKTFVEKKYTFIHNEVSDESFEFDV